MPYLVDGSNLLGVMRVDRHGDESKRGLVRLLAGFARAKKTRVTCVFDGPEPVHFGRLPGSVSVVFSGGRPADDIIAERAAQGHGWSVVTSDRGLANRVQRRHVEIVSPVAFIRDVETAAASAGEEGASQEDWDAFFSDDSNRIKF
jgi:hypothetical protein